MKTQTLFKPLFIKKNNLPLHIVFFASGGPGNIQTAFDVENLNPHLLHIGLIITDRPNIPAIEVAKKYQRPFIIYNFEALCGKAHPSDSEYIIKREQLHDKILNDIIEYEHKCGWKFDLAVLAYRRIIEGSLLEYFTDRMINQHPADLSIMEKHAPFPRKYIGIQGLSKAIILGEKKTRTSTILVKSGMDTGEILCQGPWVDFEGDRTSPGDIKSHEEKQKILSDWPSLTFALTEIAKGNFAIALEEKHFDGLRVILHKGKKISYNGFDLG